MCIVYTVYPIHWNISVNCVWKTQTLWNMGRRISGLWSLTFTWNNGTKTWGFASLPCGGNWLWWSDSNHKVLQVLFKERIDSNWDEILCQEFEKPYHRKLQLQYWRIRTEWRKFVHQKHASSNVTWIENVQSDQHSIGDGNDDS